MKYLRSLRVVTLDIIISLALIWVGWGLDDVAGFFAHPARLMLVVVILAQSLFSGYVAFVITRNSAIREKDKQEMQRIGLGLMELISLEIIFVLAPYCDRRSLAVMADIASARYLGLALYAVGIVLVFWATIALGERYSREVTARKDYALIVTGPYRYIRHPRYLGTLFYALGAALVFRSWISLAATGYLLFVSIRHIEFEEALLQQEFGYRWADYQGGSWRLIPFIY